MLNVDSDVSIRSLPLHLRRNLDEAEEVLTLGRWRRQTLSLIFPSPWSQVSRRESILADTPTSTSRLSMTRKLRLVLAAGALLALLVGASPVAAAGSGRDFSACVAHHATTMGGFSGEHNPGMHEGFAGWPGCPDA